MKMRKTAIPRRELYACRDEFDHGSMHMSNHQTMLSVTRVSADLDADVDAPLALSYRRILIDDFRNETLHEWVNDMLAADGLSHFRRTEARLKYGAVDGRNQRWTCSELQPSVSQPRLRDSSSLVLRHFPGGRHYDRGQRAYSPVPLSNTEPMLYGLRDTL